MPSLLPPLFSLGFVLSRGYSKRLFGFSVAGPTDELHPFLPKTEKPIWSIHMSKLSGFNFRIVEMFASN